MELKERIEKFRNAIFGEKIKVTVELEPEPEPEPEKTEKEKLKELMGEIFTQAIPAETESIQDVYKEPMTIQQIYIQNNVGEQELIKFKELIQTIFNGKLEGFSDQEIEMIDKLVKLQKVNLEEIQYDVVEKMDLLDTTLNDCIQVINQRIAKNEIAVINHKKLIDADKHILTKQAIIVKNEQCDLERLSNLIKTIRHYQNLN
jgi:hypothetical protein